MVMMMMIIIITIIIAIIIIIIIIINCKIDFIEKRYCKLSFGSPKLH